MTCLPSQPPGSWRSGVSLNAIPTRRVVAGFGQVGVDNRRVILQEWLAESFTMWGISSVVVMATLVAPSNTDVVRGVYFVAAGLLVALAVLTAFTGARTSVVWFKICPVLLGISAALLVAAGL